MLTPGLRSADFSPLTGASPGYMTVYPADALRPWASNLNLSPYQTVPNLVAVKTSGTGSVSIFNGTWAPVDLVVDVSGYFTA